MRTPRNRIAKSTYEVDFRFGGPRARGSILVLNVIYDHIDGSGSCHVEFHGCAPENFRQILIQCGFTPTNSGVLADVEWYDAAILSIPKKKPKDDERIHDLVRDLLKSIGVSGFGPRVKFEIVRHRDVWVGDAMGNMCWLSEGAWMCLCISSRFN